MRSYLTMRRHPAVVVEEVSAATMEKVVAAALEEALGRTVIVHEAVFEAAEKREEVVWVGSVVMIRESLEAAAGARERVREPEPARERAVAVARAREREVV